MVGLTRQFALGIVLVLAAAACAQGPAADLRDADGEESQAASTPKRITGAIRGNPHTVYQKLNPRSNIPGIDSLEGLVHTGLTVTSPEGTGRLPRLAEAAPTLDNGLWKLFPDGTMEIRWTIREGVVWQDGTPMTADDLAFTAQVVSDHDLPIFGHVAYESLGTVEAVDSRTVVARWSKPFIQADELFTYEIGLPIPKHLLDQAYLENKEQLLEHPYWNVEFVGAGPFRIKEWEQGSHMLLEANNQYVLGRPRIDEIDVRFIPDPNTLAANMLAGEVDMPWGGRIDIEWAANVADQWGAGRLETRFRSMLQIFVQNINPTPTVLSDVQFRRAMVHALDRQTMADLLQLGLSSVGHTFVGPREPEYPFIEPAVVKYTYDPQRALQMLDGLGYSQGSDGLLRDRGGTQLAFQIRTSQGDIRQEKPMYAAADDWQRLGIEVERHLVPPQRASDAEYRSTFPAFDLKGQAGQMEYARQFHSTRIALPENNFRVSGNNSRYSTPEMDLAIDRYFTTIPWEERMEWGRQIVRRLSEDVGWIGLYYEVAPVLIPNRVVNVSAGNEEPVMLDQVHEWDLRG
ncbi:MAG: hypothetical protein GEU73_14350 [Chloroflexi bacterium]|nr:hypothetical protein [Chloroflexota bacterium]